MEGWQCSPAPCRCFPSPTPGLPLHIPVLWVVRAFMLGSMQLQLFLVLNAARRYHTSNPVFRFVVWGAYLAADAVAISALGFMTHSTRYAIYGLWAPILLIHLGGPDAITAYSTADNELWTRHFFIMIYQVLVAAYVVYVSGLEGRLLAASILLVFAGATKYAERTLALRSASNTQMVISTNKIYKFMEVEGKNDEHDYHYVVMGEKNLHKGDLSVSGSPETSGWESKLREKGVVTIKNVFEQEGGQITDKYILCLSYALFKMYKRRFVGLSFHEGELPKTRKFFLSDRLSYKHVFRVIEMELKFIYDALYSKSGSTAFRKEGILLRLLNCCLLAVAAYLVIFQLTKKPSHKTVTFVIISVALAVELIQLCRIALSDWTMVYLICANIKDFSRPRGTSGWYAVKMVLFLMHLLGFLRKAWSKYWKDHINQYSMIGTRERSFRFMLKAGRSLVPFYLRVRHIKRGEVRDDLKSFIFEILQDKCSPDQEIQICRDRIYDADDYFIRKDYEELLEPPETQMEGTILAWHIATSIFERDDQAHNLPGFEVARTLSRYFAYLIVEHPNILPLHADIAVLAYLELHEKIIEMPEDTSTWTLDDEKVKDNENLKRSISLVQELRKRAVSDRWEIIARRWGELLICVAAYNKAPLHAECIAGGGEFLTQVWALLGHLGCGEQSDTAVTKRKDTKIGPKYLEEKRDEEKVKSERAKQVKWRQEKKKIGTSEEIAEERRGKDLILRCQEEKKNKIEEKLKSIFQDDQDQ